MAFGLKKSKAKKSIVATVASNPRLKTFLDAIKAAGLDRTLEDEGPFTVFAPTDDAFRELPKGRLENLLRPENKAELASLLKQHVVRGRTTSAVARILDIETLGGITRHLRVDGSGVSIDETHVREADIECSNGVIHTIDKLMMPART